MSTSEPKPPSLRTGFFWSLLTFVGARGTTFLSTLILARILAPEEFGVLAAVLAFVTLLELTSDLGMKATVIYESEKGISNRVQTAFTLNVAFTVVLMAISVALAPLIAKFFGAESEVDLFRVASLDLLLVGLGNIHDALLLRDMEFRRRLVPQLTGNVIRAIATIGLAIAGLGASALVIGFLIGTATTTVTLWIVKPFRPNFAFERAAVRAIATYGGWASALQILAAIAHRTDIAVVGNALGATALGLYTVAQRVPELIVGTVTANLSLVAFPALSDRRDRSDESLSETTVNLIRYSALFGLPISAGLAVLATPVIVVLFSETWTEAGEIMAPLAILYGLVCIVFPLGDTFKALGRQPTMVVVNLVSLPVTIAAMILAAGTGVVAVAWARLGVTAALSVVWLVLIGRALRLGIATILRTLVPGAAAAAGVAAAGYAVRLGLPGNSIGALLAASLAAAVGGVLALRIFGRAEYEEMGGLVRSRLSSRLAPSRWASSAPTAAVPVEQDVDLAPAEPRPRTRSE